jgi:hypothetical protein
MIWTQKLLIALGSTIPEMPRVCLTIVLASCNAAIYLAIGIILWQWLRSFHPEFTIAPVLIFWLLLFLTIASGVLNLLVARPDSALIYWLFNILPGMMGTVAGAFLGTIINSQTGKGKDGAFILGESSFLPSRVIPQPTAMLHPQRDPIAP